MVCLFGASTYTLAQVSAPLGTAQNYAVLAGSTVTNTGASTLTGDLGVSPGTAITGFPPGTLLNGTVEAGDAAAAQAESDTATAYSNLAGQACTTSYDVPTDIGGLVLKPGVYCFASSAQLTGALTLDGGGNPDSVWIFKTGSTLISASSASVQLINRAQQCKVFWQVGSSATFGTGTSFVGSVLASTSITLNSGAVLAGRALAINGAVTLDDNTVSFSACSHSCYEVTSRVTHTIMVAPAITDANGVRTSGTVSGVTLSPDGKTVWVAAYNSAVTPGFVSKVDVSTHGVVSSTTVGTKPVDVAFSLHNRAWVTNQLDSTLSQVDVDSGKLQSNIAIGAAGSQFPTGAAFSGNHLLVSTAGKDNTVPVYTTGSPFILQNKLPVFGQTGRSSTVPASATYFPNKVLVPVFVKTGDNSGYPSLDVIDAGKASIIASVSLPSSGAVPQTVVVTPDGHFAYVSLDDASGGAGGVWVVNLQTLRTRKVIVTGDPSNFGEAMAGDGRYLLVTGASKNQVALVFTASNSVDNIIQGGQQPTGIALKSDDSEAFVTNKADGTVTVISFSPHL
jgi:DNA-binding beta-propeller fold protein YncE